MTEETKAALIGIDVSLVRIADAMEEFTLILGSLLEDEGEGIVGTGEGWSGKRFKYVRTMKID